MYLDAESVTDAKWMEAIREGWQDFERLALLKERIEEVRREGRAERAARAERVMRRWVEKVLATARGPDVRWGQEVDYEVKDMAARQVLRMLEEL